MYLAGVAALCLTEFDTLEEFEKAHILDKLGILFFPILVPFYLLTNLYNKLTGKNQ